MNTTIKRRFSRILQILIVAALVIFVGRYLSEQWSQVRDDPPQVRWPVLILAQMALVLGMGLLSQGCWAIVRELGEGISRVQVWRLYFVSNVAKYLPGGIWALPGRAFFYERSGLPASKSVVAVFWEVLLMITSAATWALLALSIIAQKLPPLIVFVGVAGFILGMILLFAVLGSGWLRNRLERLPLPGKLRQMIARQDLWLSTGQFIRLYVYYLACWVPIGFGFAAMVYSISPVFEAGWWLEFAGVYAGAWLVGYVIILTPGGIGVRDALIIIGLTVYLADPVPAFAAVMIRIAWTLSEIIGVALSFIMHGWILKNKTLSVENL